jgi:hypothetical protein
MLYPVLHGKFNQIISTINCRPEIFEKHLNILRDYEVVMGDNELPLVIKRSKEPAGKIVWFEKVVPKAAKTLLANPDTRYRLLDVVEQLQEIVAPYNTSPISNNQDLNDDDI